MMMHHLTVPERTLSLGIALAFFAGMVMPGTASAATFAYVDRQGEVVTVVAASAAEALVNAPNMHVHSGVILLDSAADNALVGDRVAGI